jgi:predicted small secreted protein
VLSPAGHPVVRFRTFVTGGFTGLAPVAAHKIDYYAKDFTMRKPVMLALTLLALIGLGPLLGACHTAAGAGEDLSAGGHAITNSAEKHAP